MPTPPSPLNLKRDMIEMLKGVCRALCFTIPTSIFLHPPPVPLGHPLEIAMAIGLGFAAAFGWTPAPTIPPTIKVTIEISEGGNPISARVEESRN